MAILRRQTSGKKPPHSARDVMVRGGVKGVRLPLSQARLDEDDYCPHRCGGTMLITPDGDCACHIRPPCRACEESYLKCSDCGFEYRNTAEDNMVVDMVLATFRVKEVVDIPDFALYDIFTPLANKRRREVKEID